MAQPPTIDAEKVAALRQLLPATGAGIYLDTATAGPLPAETAAAMDEAEQWERRLGRAAAGREEDLQQRQDEARAVLAAMIGAEAEQVTPAAGLAAATLAGLLALGWQRGDRLLVDAGCEPSVLAAARVAARALDLEFDVGRDPLAGGREETRRMLLPAVSPVTGRRLEAGGPGLILDVSLLVGVTPLAVGEVGADMLVFAADRWALGPEATAALWLSPAVAAAAAPEPAVGQLSRSSLVGLARSVGWLEMYVGLEWAFERTATLARWLGDALTSIDGVTVLTPPDAMAGLVVFRLPHAWTAEAAADELGRRVFAIVRPLPDHGAIRTSVAWFNTEDELGRFVSAVEELSRHTPETLPRRPALTVL